MTPKFATAIRSFWGGQNELAEQLALLNRPWEEDFLHWSGDPAHPTLHGRFLPPAGRRRSVTRGGWCIAMRASDTD